MSDNEGLARRFFGAFGRADSTDVMRDAMTEDAVTWITNAEGGSDRVEGRDGWIARCPASRARRDASTWCRSSRSRPTAC